MPAAGKVLFASFDVIPSAAGTAVRAEQTLRALGREFETEALTLKTPDLSHIEILHNVRLLRVPIGGDDLPDRLLAFERAVRRQLESGDYRLVICADPFGGAVASEKKVELGLRLLYDATSVHSLEIGLTHPHLATDRKWMSGIERRELSALLHADAVIVPSGPARRRAISLGVGEDQVHLLHPPVELEPFGRVPAAPNRAPFRLLYIGSLAPWQGLSQLLGALALIDPSLDVRLAVIGPRRTAWRRQLEEIVRESNLLGKVEFASPVGHEEVPQLFSNMHACVAPLASLDRNVRGGAAPMKIAEYAAAGRPVIAPDLPAVRVLVGPEACEALYPVGDVAAMARSIEKLATSTALCDRLGAAGRAHAARTFDAALYRGQWLELARGLAEPSVIVDPELHVHDRARADGSVSNLPTSVERVLQLAGSGLRPAGFRRDEGTEPSRQNPLLTREPDTDPARRHAPDPPTDPAVARRNLPDEPPAAEPASQEHPSEPAASTEELPNDPTPIARRLDRREP